MFTNKQYSQEISTLIQKEHIKLIKSDRKVIYKVTEDFNFIEMLTFLCQTNQKKCITVSTRIFSGS